MNKLNLVKEELLLAGSMMITEDLPKTTHSDFSDPKSWIVIGGYCLLGLLCLPVVLKSHTMWENHQTRKRIKREQ